MAGNSRGRSRRSYTGRSGMVSEDSIFVRTIFRVLFFPLLFMYLELTLHIYMRTSLKYCAIWLLFGISMGFFFSAVTMPFKRKVNRVLVKVFTPLLTLIYAIELVAKKILQNYYPFSALGLAAENKLTDYADAILSAIISSIPVLIILFLPTVFIFVLGDGVLLFPRSDVRFAGLVAGLLIVFHLLGLLTVHLSWEGDLTPAKLYKVDTNLDDQVEQLGLLTMLRLDIKHQFVPAGSLRDDDFGTTPSARPSAAPSDKPAGPAGSAEPDPSGEPDPEPTPTLDTSPNVMDIDLDAIAELGGNDDIKWLAKYFNSKTPTNRNEYTGMFKGYNVIFLTLEGFSGYGISEELTPTLYRLTHEGFVFENFYTPLHYTSTSGGECQNLLGLYPKDGNPATMKRTGAISTNCYFSLAQQLGRLGYTNLGYHANGDMYGRLASHTNLGYEWKQSGSGFVMEQTSAGKNGWPQRDKYLIDATVDEYLHLDTPFNIYYMTISGHMPYSNNWVAQQYRSIVDPLPYTATTKNYLATCIEVDRALEELIAKLDAAGKLDSTLIVAAPDHVPYFNVETLEELSGMTFGSSADLEYLKEGSINIDVYHSSLIIWSGSMTETVNVKKVCCQVDILPTVSNLLGLEYDSRLLSGSDIFSDAEGQVIFHSRSWLTDAGYYNRYTQKFTPAEGVAMTEQEQKDYVSSMVKQVSNKLSCTALIVENNFYDYVFNKFQG